MDETINFSLEALRESRAWSMWIVGLAGTAMAAIGLFSGKVKEEHKSDVRFGLIFSGLSFASAITVIASVPSLIAQLPTTPETNPFDMLVFNYIPFWIINSSLHAFIILAGIFGLRVVWRELFG